MVSWLRAIPGALARARIPILTIAATYVLSVTIGIAMVHAGSSFALSRRDKIVAKALKTDPSAIANRNQHHVRAALLDFAGNLFLGAVPNTVSGMGIVFPYPIAVFRGWVGGIVSVNSAHKSRLALHGEGAYYFTVIILQLIPYSLAGGAGVYLGLAWYKGRPLGIKAYWWPLPRQALFDVLRIYLLIVPLFLIASLVEFCW